MLFIDTQPNYDQNCVRIPSSIFEPYLFLTIFNYSNFWICSHSDYSPSIYVFILILFSKMRPQQANFMYICYTYCLNLIDMYFQCSQISIHSKFDFVKCCSLISRDLSCIPRYIKCIPRYIKCIPRYISHIPRYISHIPRYISHIFQYVLVLEKFLDATSVPRYRCIFSNIDHAKPAKSL